MYKSLRLTFAACIAAALTAAAGCSSGGDVEAKNDAKANQALPVISNGKPLRLIGDGSTAWTGLQPHQPKFGKLRPGQKPPQFVVFSWDGAGEDGSGLFRHFREVGKKYDATMTYFLSGLYVLPESRRGDYHAPGHEAGASDIGFLNDLHVRQTIEQVRAAWLDGSEIGTHFNGHFCGPTGGDSWSVADWKSEIDQAKRFVKTWKTTTGLTRAAPLPFDYDKELVGARTPCLEGRDNLVKAAGELGWRYDTSGVNLQVWPRKEHGVWDLSMQTVPFPGSDLEELTMDYNYSVNPRVTPATAENQMYRSLMMGFDRSYAGNRAPLIIGNHFEQWGGGAYMRAVEHTIKTLCPRADVHCVSFRQLADWLDAQDPQVLDKLRGLEVGQAPADGWARYLAPPPPARDRNDRGDRNKA
ncbi:hypothetical protein SRB5_05300 [Streptomyces sp. RB5]|uniref:Secreted protein n=1 Tax=Streptomyces smaragdinus TaxID=2585196 RepID=A0A7K0CBB4_9ACTN|nr:hypothetical protein [Streptomyces smaragdinus]MQY10422.1 hypothetical protein [Streptomyces smaragdinus]